MLDGVRNLTVSDPSVFEQKVELINKPDHNFHKLKYIVLEDSKEYIKRSIKNLILIYYYSLMNLHI